MSRSSVLWTRLQGSNEIDAVLVRLALTHKSRNTVARLVVGSSLKAAVASLRQLILTLIDTLCGTVRLTLV